jgi:hypothetical protein
MRATVGDSHMLASTSSLILDYLHVLIWPVVVAGLAMYIFLTYRENIRSLINRIVEVRGPGGTGLAIGPPSQDAATEGDEDAVDEALEEALAELAEAQQEQEDLIERLVAKEFEADFERLYGSIFGTQLRTLRALRAAEPEGLPRIQLESIYSDFLARVQAVSPPARAVWTFEGWMNYLLIASYAGSLAAVAPDSGNYRITQKGVAFLAYL